MTKSRLKLILVKFFNKKTFIKMFISAIIALSLKYTILYFEGELVNNINWINNDYFFSLVISVISLVWEFIYIIIESRNMEPSEISKFIANVLDEHKSFVYHMEGLNNSGKGTGNNTSTHANLDSQRGSSSRSTQQGLVDNITSIKEIEKFISDDNITKGKILVKGQAKYSDALIKPEPIRPIKFTPEILRNIEADKLYLFNFTLEAQKRGYYTMTQLNKISLNIIEESGGADGDTLKVNHHQLRHLNRNLATNTNNFLTPFTKDSMTKGEWRELFKSYKDISEFESNKSTDLQEHNEQLLKNFFGKRHDALKEKASVELTNRNDSRPLVGAFRLTRHELDQGKKNKN